MKKTLYILFLSVITLSCSNQQQSTAVVKSDDELTLNVQKLLKVYVENDFTLWEELLSDDCVVLFNNIPLDKKSVIAGISQDHTLFKSIEVTDDYAHTNYFNNGQIWTNHWFTLTFVGNFTEETTSNRAHTDLKWENGKVVRFQVYYDPTFQIKEATAMSEMSK
tara:strand:+ start:30751 stop:31242 length:492 start_codon:yes stop_codon:yes gene_type:complete